MEETTLIKSGEVSVQVKSLLKSVWVSKFCTLHKKTAENHAYMEIYDDKQAHENYKQKGKKCDFKKIELQQVKSIRSSSENMGKGMEHHIEIRLKYHKHFLMFKRESDFRDWLSKLNSTVDIADRGSADGSASYSGDLVDSDDSDDGDDDEVITLNQLYASTETAQRFEVEVEPSDLAKLCGIEGTMTLLVGNNDLSFEDPKTKRFRYTFQLNWMRRFGKYKTQSFNFEVGRKCPNGQGSVTCKTPSARAIHKIVTQKSSSRSKVVIPHAHTEEDTPSQDSKSTKSSVSNVDEEVLAVPPPIKERQGGSIGKPTFANNLARKHPGKANTPNLIPIVREPTDDDLTSKKPKTPPQPVRHGSKGKLRNSGKESPDDEKKVPTLQDNGHTRPESYRTAVKSEDFTKELEQKLHLGNDEHTNQESEKSHDPGKKDSVKTKEDKRREKEEKKERERKEKEEKKERERKEKEMEKERKLREKEEKKSGKRDKQKDVVKTQDKPKTRQMSMRERIYDEPEVESPESSDILDDPSGTYDEVTSPRQAHAPAEYAQSTRRKAATKVEDIYDEAVSPTTGKNMVPEKVEYAEPYSKKGGVPVPQEPAMYADVKTVQKDAWKKLGRKEEEECFEENYDRIKSARSQVQQQTPPPVPVKNYSDEEDGENMYNTVDLKNPKAASKSKTENLYGIASATEVGEIPTDMVLVPERDYSSDSGEEEATYDEAQYEGYEAPSDIKENNTKKTKVVEAYEDAVVPIKPSPPKQSLKKRQPKETLYEEIS